jgi:hypothetical protein
MKEAQEHTRDYPWFYGSVHNKARWDYKQKGRQYAAYGNFNYGAVGLAAGFDEGVLLRAAGAAQVAAGTSKADYGSPVGAFPYGDDPVDQVMIEYGMAYYRWWSAP